MSTPIVDTRDRHLIAVIGDQVHNDYHSSSIPSQDTVTGMLLAGIGATDIRQRRNYLVVDSSNQNARISSPPFVSCIETTDAQIEEAFKQFTRTRHDIAIILLTHSVAARIRHLVDEYAGIMPVVLEIPSREGEGANPDLKRPSIVA